MQEFARELNYLVNNCWAGRKFPPNVFFLSILRCKSKNDMFYTVANLVLNVVGTGLYGGKMKKRKLHRKSYTTTNLKWKELRCEKENCEFTP